jgi:hypothetical protein
MRSEIMESKEKLMLSNNHKVNLTWLIIMVSFALILVMGVLGFGKEAKAQTGNTYYVDINSIGGPCSDSNPGTITQPWQTISKANQVLEAGDMVYIRAGTYSITGSGIDPANTGTSGLPITYSNYNDEEVEFIGDSDGCFAVDLNSDYGTIRSYIIVKGMTFTNFYRHMWILRGSHNEIAYCKFQGLYPRADNGTAWRGSTIYRNAQYNHIHHNIFSDYGHFLNENDNGVVFELGNEYADDDNTSYNLIEYNTLYHGGHHVMGVGGNHNVVRNNYFHNEAWWEDNGNIWGNRIMFFAGFPNDGRNLFEGNRVAYGGETVEPGQIGGSGGTLATSNNIIRKNMYYQCLIYGTYLTIYSGGACRYNKIYNNVYWYNGHSTTGPEKENWVWSLSHAIKCNEGDNVRDNALKNNIFYENRNYYGADMPIIGTDLQIISNNWKGGVDGYPKFVNISGTPDPYNETQFNFNLQSDSPCIDNGGFLTVITSSTGSGTTFTVDDAGYFMDGWGIVDGDTIQLEGQTQTAQITNVNYDTNIITVDISLTWNQGQGISLAYEGSAPDAGAYEYMESGQGIIPPSRSNPDKFSLQQNYPNPFNPSTTIKYSVAKPCNVQIIIYNRLGQEVYVLVNDQKPAGEYNVRWDGKNAKGNKLASGIYYYRLTAGKQVDTKKMLYLR